MMMTPPGTGSRVECVQPTRVLEDCHVTVATCGADSTLAQDAAGNTWGWGSNFYSQVIPPIKNNDRQHVKSALNLFSFITHIDVVLLYPNVSLIVKEKVTRSIRERVSNSEGEGNKINKRTCL